MCQSELSLNWTVPRKWSVFGQNGRSWTIVDGLSLRLLGQSGRSFGKFSAKTVYWWITFADNRLCWTESNFHCTVWFSTISMFKYSFYYWVANSIIAYVILKTVTDPDSSPQVTAKCNWFSRTFAYGFKAVSITT